MLRNQGASNVDAVPPEVRERVSSISQTVTPAAFRSVMSQFATGVTVLTVGGEHIHGMTANAFTSVSLEPPLILCCVAHTAVMHKAITATGRFGLSIMGANQEPIARYFADKARPLGPAQFDVVEWFPGPLTQAPLIFGSLGWLECALVETYDCGDHSIFLGNVLGSGHSPDRPALLFFEGAYHEVVPPTV